MHPDRFGSVVRLLHSSPLLGAALLLVGGQGLALQVQVQGTPLRAPAHAQLVPPDPGDPPPPPSLWLGEKKLAVVLIDLVGAPYLQPGQSLASLKASIVGQLFTNPDSTNAYWQEVSEGRLSITGHLEPLVENVFGPVAVGFPATPCDREAWALAAVAALESDATVDFDASNYDLIAFSNQGSCGATGLPDFDPPAAIMRNFSLRATVHELGHAIGLQHASSLLCDPGQPLDDCEFLEYGDLFDSMGDTGTLWYNQQKLGQKGWLDPVDTVTVTQSGTYSLYPLESTAALTRVLRVPRVTGPFGPEEYYYVELRQPSGFDNFTENAPVANGTLVRLARGYDRQGRSYLIDAVPSTSTLYDAPFVPATGQPAVFQDALTGTTISTVSVTKTGVLDTTYASVTITPGTVLSCSYGDPQVTLSRQYLALQAGDSKLFTITLVNGDSVNCPRVPITGTWAGLPQGWGPETLTNFDRTLVGGDTVTIDKLLKAPVGAATQTFTATLNVLNTYTGRTDVAQLTVDVVP